MGGLFAKKTRDSRPGTAINNRDRAIYELKVQRDRLKKYIARNDALIEREVAIARQLLSQKKKERAKLVIKKKKYLESTIEKALAKIANVEELVNSIQFAEMSAQVFAALKEGSETLQKINAQMDIDEVAKLMDDTAEAINYQEEISNLLSAQLSEQDSLAAEQELERLEFEEAAKLEFPSVPVSRVDRGEFQTGNEDNVDEREKQVILE